MSHASRGTTDFDPRQFRTAMGQFCTGVTVITTLDAEGSPAGFACQSFAALSLDPPLVLFCPQKTSRAVGRSSRRPVGSA